MAAITSSKSFLPGTWNGTLPEPAPLSAPVNQGEVVWLSITVLNNSTAPVTALNGTDPLPAGITLAEAPTPFAIASCASAGPGDFTAVPGDSNFSFSGLTVPAYAAGVNGACTVYVRVKVTGPTGSAAGSLATLNNTIPASTGPGTGVRGTEGGSTVVNGTPATQSIQVIKLANLSVSKAFAPSTVAMGATAVANITITNNAAAANALSSFVDNLPSSLTATTVPTVACSGAGVPASATAMGGSLPNLTFPAGTTLAANGSCTVSFTVRAEAQSGNNGYTATNNVPANAVGNSRGLTSQAASANLTVQSPLLSTKSFSPNPARANELVTMTLSLQNRSAFAISAGSFTDNLPAPGGAMTVRTTGATAAGGNAGGCSAAGALTATAGAAVITGAGLAIPANSTCSYTVQVQVSDDGSYVNTIPTTTYTSADSNVGGPLTNGPASATLTAYDQLTASKSGRDPRNTAIGAGNVAPGNRVVYQIFLSNYSLSAINDLQVVDPLPTSGGAQLSLVASVPPAVTGGAGCAGPASVSGSATTPVFSGISLPAGTAGSPASCTLSFTVQVPDNWPVGADMTNSIPATNISYGGGAFTLQGPAVTDNRPYIDRLTTTKTVSASSVFQGDTALVTITLFNNSYNDMTSAQFSDNPLFGASNSVRVANPANPTTTCGGTPAYAYTAGGASFSASGLTVPQRGSCSVSFKVVGITPGGPYTNTLAAANVSGTVDNGAGPVTFNATNSPTANLTVNSVLVVGKSFAPATVSGAGGVSRVTLSLQNVGVSALTNLAATDPLPSGLLVANPANASTTCGGAPVFNAASGASSAGVSGVTLYAGTTCLVQFDVISSVGTASTNTLPAGGVTADNGVFNASPASAVLSKFTSPGVNISKAFSPSTLAAAGSVSRLRVNVQNVLPGAVLLTDLGFVDNMPPGMVLGPNPDPVSDCSGAVLTAEPGASSFRMSRATLAPASTCFVAVNVSLNGSGTFVNTLPSGVVTNAQAVTNADAFSSPLGTLAALGVDKAFTPRAAAPNTPVELKIRVLNALPSAVSNVSLTDPLPAGVVPASPSVLSTTCAGAAVSASSTEVRLTGGLLEAASGGVPSTCDITLRVQAGSVGTYTNTIPIGNVTGQNGGNVVSNGAPASAVFTALLPLGVSKAFANPYRQLNQSNRLTITVSNPNGVAVNNVALTDTLPAGVYLATAANAATTCAASTIVENGLSTTLPVAVSAPSGGTAVRLSGAGIAAGSSCTVAVDVLSNVVSTFTNLIPEGAITSHEGLSNASAASAQFSTLEPPTLGKQFVPLQIASGASSKLRIVLGNNNAVALTLSAALVDTLPTSPGPLQLTATTPLDAGATTCPGSVTAPANGTSITYANGASIPVGGCVIVVNVTGTVDGTYNNVMPAGALQTSGGPNPQPATASLSISSTLASVSGRVYRDHNNNGTPDALEPGISAQLIELLDLGGAVVASVTTDSLGNYAFLGLTPGTYSIRQASQPAGTLNGITAAGAATAGGSAGVAASVATSPSTINTLAVAAGQSSINNNFGEVVPSRLAGRVFLDVNNSGTQQTAEPGLSGVPVLLTGTDDQGAVVNQSTTTASDGSYSFSGLRPGNYTLTEGAQPTGTANGITTPGAVNTVGSASAAPGGVPGTATGPTVNAVAAPSGTSRIGANGGASVAITLPPNAESLNNNFAEIPTSSSISGRVYADTNNNGLAEAGEAGLAGVTLELTGVDLSGQPVSRTTLSLADGSYSFVGLAPGVYAVREPSQPAGTLNGITTAGGTGGTATPLSTVPSNISAISLAANQSSAGNNFGEIPGASISGKVFVDYSNNGIVDAGDFGLSGISLVLTGTDDQGGAVNRTLVTAADGSYSFDALRPGTYTVTEPTQPPETLNGITNAGTIAGTRVGTATASAVTPSVISAIVLPLGAASIENNFAEIGNSPDLKVTKTHLPAIFTVNNPGTYTLSVRNLGLASSTGVYTVSDRLPTGFTLAALPTGTGWACTGAVGASTFSCVSSEVVARGAINPNAITATVNVAASALTGAPAVNAVMVDGGGEPDARRPTPAERDAFNSNPGALPLCTAITGAFDQNACREPTPVQLPASVSGTAWYDIGATPGLLDRSDRRLPGWRVEVVDVASGAVLRTATTGADGSYRVSDLVPGVPLAVRFRDPASNAVFGYPVNGETAAGSSGAACDQANALANGLVSSCVERGALTQLTVVLRPGQDLPQQSLPVDPSGVVYDATTRLPVPGAVVTLAPVGLCTGYSPAGSIANIAAGGYTVNGNATSMTVGADGFYQFLFAPAAPASCTFALTVTPPAGYRFVSSQIPPQSQPLNPGGAPGSTFAVQPQATAPTAAPNVSTIYYLQVISGSAGANVIHNHIPLDPTAPAVIALSKQANRQTAEVGETVLYTLTLRHVSGTNLPQVTVRDRLPAGFTYIAGTARVNNLAISDPVGGLGPTLGFTVGGLSAGNTVSLTYRLRVGVGAIEGDGTNRARAWGCGTPAGCLNPATLDPVQGAVPSNEAQATVKVSGGVFTRDACVLGKVFVDCNGNSVQDPEELGVPGVRLYMEDGTYLVSDSEGKYSMCGLSPRSHTLKVDPLTLPRGSRLTTSSNRNLGDAGSLFIDLKAGELHRADFIEGSCSNTVLEQVKARRAQGEVRSIETERKGGPALRFESKPLRAPQQGTDSANQPAVTPRPNEPPPTPPPPTQSDKNTPVPSLPINAGRDAASQGAGNVR